jgi:hypothetical protein
LTDDVHIPPTAYLGNTTPHWNVPLLRVPDDGAVAVHDCDWVTKLAGGTNVWMLNEQVAVLTPEGESATPIVQVTVLGPPPVLIEVGANPKLVSDGAVMSSGFAVTPSVAEGMIGEKGKLPARSDAKTLGAHVPASA